LRPALLYPTHGPPITRPEETIERFARHRRDRVDQAGRALQASGSRTAGELVEIVYGDTLDARLRWAAEASIRASLEYLRQQGRAVAIDAERFAMAYDPHLPHVIS
jgi:hypothetical protein